MAHAPPLTPMSLDRLLGRIAHEWETRRRIFDLPTARFYDVSSGPDLEVSFLGRPAATPLGPAAGPHSQLAENIVLAWLGGSRVIELKTVQILDELVINRPCIDMETIGYNIEWSQELKITQSLEEYVKAWMIVEILSGWDELTPLMGADPGPLVFDISVGYDLAGISTPEVGSYIDEIMDATRFIDELRPQIPEPFTKWRHHEFDPRISGTATLSTFHGCPPNEIEDITKHLMTRHGLDVIVKLNPTLLGYDQVGEIVNTALGYDDVRLRKSDFDADLQFDRAIELIGELRRFAAANERRFGIKLTNTLVVENRKQFLPDETMYLSGPPLHVVTSELLGRLHAALPGELRVEGSEGPIQVSWSAGITKDNFAGAAGLGLVPITVCSDLLKPGGYGRLKPMLRSLAAAMEGAGVADLTSWVALAQDDARARGAAGAVQAHLARLRDPSTNGAYTKAGNSKLPRAVDHDLEKWGCVACNFCVTVCPNDAFFQLPTVDGLGIEGRQQYFVLTELCNECGNCLVFCPENGDPAVIKPRLFIDPERFMAETEQAYLITARADGEYMVLPNEAGVGRDGDILARMLNGEDGFVLPLDKLATA